MSTADDRGRDLRRVGELPLFQADPTRRPLPVPRPPRDATVTPLRPTDPVPAAQPRAVDTRLVDWSVVRELREDAATRMTARRAERGELTQEADRELGRSVIAALIADHIQDGLAAGAPAVNTEQRTALTTAVFDSLFRLGRLQPLVDEAGVENIEVMGQQVYVTYPDGRVEERPPISDSNDELVDWLTFLAGHADGGGRAFSESQPSLRLNLPGNVRLSAMAWRTKVPTIAIRLHRLKDISLTDLVGYKVLPQGLADLLAACTRSRTAIVVSGGQGSGKTTMVRALANAWDPLERIGVAETERELFLDEMGDRHLRVISAEAYPGGGERRPDGTMAGAYTLGDILYDFVRQNLTRLVIGEVAGPEIMPMFQAMEIAAGTLTTTHAKTAKGAINRLVTLGGLAGLDPVIGTRRIAESVDLIVQLQATDRTDDRGGRYLRRYVSEVIVVEEGGDGTPTLSTLYRGTPDGTGQLEAMPQSLRDTLNDSRTPVELMVPRRLT